MIYREGEKKLDKSIQLLSRLLLDSEEYKLCIHPLSLEELKKYRNEEQKMIVLSKANVYKKIDNPPIISDDFIKKYGVISNSHDLNDATLLYMLERNCVSYLLTNDKGLQRKSENVGLKNRVFSIDEAITFLSSKDKSSISKNPIIISNNFLYTIDTSDSFFDSLREDYYGFDMWINEKKKMHKKAYVSYMENDKIGAFLMLKTENETENYDKFDKPFNRGKRVKISTFKVSDNGKSLGEALIKIAVNYALEKNINEIYVTIFRKQEKLIELLTEFGFDFYTYKETIKGDNIIEKEMVYLKRMDKNYTLYPIIIIKDQNIFVVPIQHKFSHMLFPDIFEMHQISMNDLEGTSTYSNAVKKVYISKSKMSMIKKGDILIFYSSEIRKSLICVGVVDDVFRANEMEDFEKFEKIVKRRTVYKREYLKESFENGYLVILFKHYLNLSKHITLEEALRIGILNGPPQSIQSMHLEKFKKLVEISRSDRQIKI